MRRAIVRELFHEWLVGLTQGELRRPHDVALSPEKSIRQVTEMALASLLAQLPPGEPTRISVARFIGEYQVDRESYLEVVELGGFVTLGPLAVSDIVERYGLLPFRVSAYSMARPSLLWEVLVQAA